MTITITRITTRWKKWITKLILGMLILIKKVMRKNWKNKFHSTSLKNQLKLHFKIPILPTQDRQSYLVQSNLNWRIEKRLTMNSDKKIMSTLAWGRSQSIDVRLGHRIMDQFNHHQEERLKRTIEGQQLKMMSLPSMIKENLHSSTNNLVKTTLETTMLILLNHRIKVWNF